MSILLQNISKSFGDTIVCNELTLSIPQGEFHVILGPSGEGKSTILSIVAGLEFPDTGDVVLQGSSVLKTPSFKRPVGLVFQDGALFPHLTVKENILFGLKAKKVGTSTSMQRLLTYSNLLGLDSLLERKPEQLSGGEKQRVALARALALEPEILLLDEPLCHLDPLAQNELIEEIKKIHKNLGLTVLHVTHDLREAQSLADRISILHKGTIEQMEKPSQVLYHPKTSFVAEFVGARNIIDVGLVSVNGSSALTFIHSVPSEVLQVQNYPLLHKEKRVSLCIHPERIIINPTETEENIFLVTVCSIRNRGEYKEVTFLLGDIRIYGHVPIAVPVKEQEELFIALPKDALHPICGMKSKRPKGERPCKKSVFNSKKKGA